MNIVRTISLVLFLLSLVSVIIYLTYLCINDFDSNNISKSLNTIASTFTAITSALSVIIATLNISATRKQFTESKKTEVFNYWYKELVIDAHLTKIKRFFDNCESLIDSIEFEQERIKLNGNEYNELLIQKIFIPFTSEYTKLHRDLISDLNIIDNTLANSISEIFSKYQDDFSLFFDNMHIDVEKIHICAKKYYREIVKNLMNYNMDPPQITLTKSNKLF